MWFFHLFYRKEIAIICISDLERYLISNLYQNLSNSLSQTNYFIPKLIPTNPISFAFFAPVRNLASYQKYSN